MVTVQKSPLWVNCYDQVRYVCVGRQGLSHKICKHIKHPKHNTQPAGICKTSWRGGVAIPTRAARGLLGGCLGRLLGGGGGGCLDGCVGDCRVS